MEKLWEMKPLEPPTGEIFYFKGKKIDTTNIIKELKSLSDICDEEVAHLKADKILCNLLSELGYADVVEQYNEIEKRYA